MSEGDNFPITRPTRPGTWEVVARSQKIADQWDEFSKQAAGGCQRVYDQLATEPLYEDGDRQQRLVGEAGRVTFKGVTYERRQIDVTGAGRVWYFVDPTPYGSGQKKRLGKVFLDTVAPGGTNQKGMTKAVTELKTKVEPERSP